MPRYKSKAKRLSPRQQRNWSKVKRAAARSKNKNRPLFKRKTRTFTPSMQRGKPKKVGTSHWLTASSFGRKSPKGIFLKGLKRSQLKEHVVVIDAFSISSVVGLQAVSNSANTGKMACWTPRQIYDMAAETAQGINEKLLLLNCQTRLLGTNQSNANQFLEIYEIVNRQDVQIQNTIAQTPVDAWGGTSESETITTNVPGQTPFQTRAFTLLYKVLKITRYNLNPGESFEHIMNDHVNKPFDVYKTQNISNQQTPPTANQGGFRGLTKWHMIVQWSAPYNDVTTKTQVSLGAGNVDYVFTKRFTFEQIQISGATTNLVSNNLPNAFTVAEDIMNDDSGAAAALANA